MADGTIIIDTEIQTDGMKPGTKDIEASVRRMANSVNDLGKKSEIALQKQAYAFAKINASYAVQEQKVQKLQRKLEEYGNTKLPTQEYIDIQNQISAAEKKLAILNERQEKFLQTGGKTRSSAYRKLQYDIEELTNTVKYAKGELAALEASGGAFTFGRNTDQFAQLSDQYKKETLKLSQMNETLGASYARIKNEFTQYQNRLLGIDRANKKADKSGKKLNKTLKGTKKASKDANFGLKRMLMTSLLFSTIFRALSIVAAGFKDGMDNLALYSKDTNAALSLLLSSMTRLKNAFATSFSPLIELAAPSIEKFISLLAESVTWTSQLFAALTGKDTYTKAVKVEEDYAESIRDSNKALKEKEKLSKKVLYAFDQLIQAQGSNDASSNQYIGPTPDQMFETEEIPNEVKAQADAIKKTFSDLFTPLRESWEDNGPQVMRSLSNLFRNAKQLASDVGASFMQVWKVEGYGQAITDNLIITFANLIQTAANLIRQFDIAWRSGETGTAIIRSLGDMVLIFTGFIREASESIKDWSDSVDFSPLLTSVGRVLEALTPIVDDVGDVLLWLIDNALLPIASWAIEQAVPGAFDLIAAALTALRAVIVALEPLAMWLWDTFLQPLGKWTGEVIILALKKLVEWLTKFSDWISENQVLVENITLAVLAFFAAWKVVEFVSGIAQIIKSMGGLVKAGEIVIGMIKSTVSSISPLSLAIGGIISLIAVLAKNWDKMTPEEKVVAGILAAAAAVAVLVVALGGLTGPAGIAAVTAALAAGIAAATIAIKAGQRTVGSMTTVTGGHGGGSRPFSAYSAVPYRMPRLATGTVVPPRAGEFAAILGDNNREPEVVSPLSTMKQAFKEALLESEFSSDRNITVIMEVDGRRFGEVVYKANNQETQRVGVRMVTP